MMPTNDQEHNRRERNSSPGNVVDLGELLRRRQNLKAGAGEEPGRWPDPEEDFKEDDDFSDDGFSDDDYPEPDGTADEENTPGPSEEPLPEEEDRSQKKHRPRERKERKKLRPAQIAGDILISLLMLVLVAAAAVMIYASLTPVKEIRVDGRRYTEEDPLISWYFPTEKSRLLSRLTIRMIRGVTPPPAISSGKIVLLGLNECEIRITEKEAAFTIAMQDGSGVLLVTPDGEVLRHLEEKPEHLALITGIHALFDEPLMPAVTDQPETFKHLLKAVRIVREFDFETDELYIQNGSLCLDIGDVTVSLGTDDYLREKLTELMSQIPAFEGLKGTLHLEDYDGGKNSGRFTFEVKP